MTRKLGEEKRDREKLLDLNFHLLGGVLIVMKNPKGRELFVQLQFCTLYRWNKTKPQQNYLLYRNSIISIIKLEFKNKKCSN